MELYNRNVIEVGAQTLINVQFKPPSTMLGVINSAVSIVATSIVWADNNNILL